MQGLCHHQPTQCHPSGSILRTFHCQECNVSFGSDKALSQHNRVVHRARCEVNRFVGDWRSCPVCHTKLACRANLISHLSETRIRSKFQSKTCKQMFLDTGPPVVDPSLLLRLNDTDRLARRNASRNGHTHIIANAPAVIGARGARVKMSSSKLVPTRRVSVKSRPADVPCRVLSCPHPARDAVCPRALQPASASRPGKRKHAPDRTLPNGSCIVGCAPRYRINSKTSNTHIILNHHAPPCFLRVGGDRGAAEAGSD